MLTLSATTRLPALCVWLAWSILVSTLAAIADDAVIDLRTFIPGVVDAPVYHADGTTRLSGSRYQAGFFVASDLHPSFTPIIWLPFGTNEWAGYCSAGDPSVPNPVVLPFNHAGERVWITVRAQEPHPGAYIPEDIPPPRFTGESQVFSLIVSNTPTPLIGLKSFRFDTARIQWNRQGDQLVMRWSAGDGTVNYDLEVISSLDGTRSWQTSVKSPVLERISFSSGWMANWVVTNTLSGPGTFYRLRLLNP